jgi:hypothetical protein
MKSYIQGLITGGVFIFAFIVLVGQSNNSDGYSIGLPIPGFEIDGHHYYVIKEKSEQELYRMVKIFLKSGCSLQGGISIDGDYFAQAVYKNIDIAKE